MNNGVCGLRLHVFFSQMPSRTPKQPGSSQFSSRENRQARLLTDQQQQRLASNHDLVDVPIATGGTGYSWTVLKRRKQPEHFLSCT
jgi:hypothetical protein